MMIMFFILNIRGTVRTYKIRRDSREVAAFRKTLKMRRLRDGKAFRSGILEPPRPVAYRPEKIEWKHFGKGIVCPGSRLSH